MDQKVVKKMKKRRDLDKLIGNGRKHFRKKSGHVLLRTDSQSSVSSDETDHLSLIRYRRSRCSSVLTYANVFLSVFLLLVCCVLIASVIVMRSELSSLQEKNQSIPDNEDTKSYQLQEMYNRIQSLQIHIHHLSLNLTKHAKYFKRFSQRISSLEKDIRHFQSYERLLGSLSNVPARLKELNHKSEEQSRVINGFKNGMYQANYRIEKLSNDLLEMKKKTTVDVKDSDSSIPKNLSAQIGYATSRAIFLQQNVSQLSLRISLIEKYLQKKRKPQPVPIQKNDHKNDSSISEDAFRNLQKHVILIGTKLHNLEKRIESLTSNETETGALREQQEKNDKISTSVQNLNSSLHRLLKHIPDVRLTLGFGVVNATFPKEPLGHGVILTRDEYFKLRKLWAKSSDTFILSIQSKKRVDELQKKFDKLKKQVIDGIKNIRVLEAIGVKPTERPVDKNHPEMDVNVPIPVYTPTPNPNAHLSLPWVKTVRDAEINFARWNRNGDGVLSGEELDPSALRGFMGPHAPSKAQLEHFDVNHDGQLTKREVLCLFGFISWPCTGKIHKLPTSTPSATASVTTPQSSTAEISKPTKAKSNFLSSSGTTVAPTAASKAHEDGNSLAKESNVTEDEVKSSGSENSHKGSVKVTSKIAKLTTKLPTVPPQPHSVSNSQMPPTDIVPKRGAAVTRGGKEEAESKVSEGDSPSKKLPV